MEEGAGGAERSISMDERDVVISRMRRELEEAEASLIRTKEVLLELKANNDELRDRYTQLVGGIMDMISKVKGE